MRDFEVVRLFLKIVECRSLVGAARALGLPRSSVSRKLADLEADVGARLVQRSTRSFGLTEAGMQVHAQFERIAEATAAIAEAVGAPGVQGLLRVTAPISFAQAMIAPVIPAFLRAHPDVRIQLDANTRRVNLIAEEFDVAIRAGRVQDSALVSRKLSAMALCASPGYLAAQGPVEFVWQLASQTVIAFNPSGEPPKSWTRLHREFRQRHDFELPDRRGRYDRADRSGRRLLGHQKPADRSRLQHGQPIFV